ncbi:hypothetical protein [Desulfoluna sp.]|uniref:hypothetical protein n=1 Tax=Desulfoluna sp. TaxID=2045199 RepID=UPI0026086C92|nr:hypothetical protein [Desulfoluna sp.]
MNRNIRKSSPMITFDMKTAIFTYIFINYLYSLVIGFTWYQNRRQNWGIEGFLADFLLKSIGMTLACLRSTLPPILSVVFANLLMFSGTLFLFFGMARFLKVRIPRPPFYLYTILFTALYAYFTLIHPDIRIRIVLFSGMLTPVVAAMSWLVFAVADPAHRKYATHAGITFGLFALVFMMRCVCALTGDPISNYFNQPITDSLLTLVCQILSVDLAYALLLMIHHKLADGSMGQTDPF